MYSYWYKKWTGIYLAVFSVYLIFFFIFLYHLRIEDTQHNSAIIDYFLNTPLNNVTGFNDVNNASKLYEYISHNLPEKLYITKYYEGQPLEEFKKMENLSGEMSSLLTHKLLHDQTKAGFFASYVHKIIGLPRIRQQRVKNNTCTFPLTTKQFMNNPYGCHAPLENNEDFYHEATKQIKDVFGQHDPYGVYKTHWESDTIGRYAKTGVYYHAGGHMVSLGDTKSETLVKASSLKDVGWIDEYTRVVIIEMLLYNVHTNMFSFVSLIAENYANGIFLPTTIVNSVVVPRSYLEMTSLLGLFIFIIIMTYMVARNIYLIELYGCYRYFRKLQTITSVFTMIFGISGIFYWILQIIYAIRYEVMLYEGAIRNDYALFCGYLYKEKIRNALLALSTMLIFVKLAYYLTINVVLKKMTLTVLYIIKITFVLFIFTIILLICTYWFTLILQNPEFPLYVFLPTSHLGIRNSIARLLRSEDVGIPVLISCICLVCGILISMYILFYFTVVTFNLSHNYFIFENKWKLANFIPFHLKSRRVRLRAGDDNLIRLPLSHPIKKKNTSISSRKQLAQNNKRETNSICAEAANILTVILKKDK